jgi:hypothetical protein
MQIENNSLENLCIPNRSTLCYFINDLSNYVIYSEHTSIINFHSIYGWTLINCMLLIVITIGIFKRQAQLNIKYSILHFVQVPLQFHKCSIIVCFLDSATVKQTYSPWVGRTWRKEWPTLRPECALTKKNSLCLRMFKGMRAASCGTLES